VEKDSCNAMHVRSQCKWLLALPMSSRLRGWNYAFRPRSGANRIEGIGIAAQKWHCSRVRHKYLTGPKRGKFSHEPRTQVLIEEQFHAVV
jgi:hypothetical protein